MIGGCACGAVRFRLDAQPRDAGRRAFCGDCGTPLFMQDDTVPATLDFSVATLDAPGAVTPAFHIYYASRIGWAPAADDLPRYDHSRTGPPC